MRFSRERRFSQSIVGLNDFLTQANRLVESISVLRGDCVFEVLTCEDSMVYQYSKLTIVSDEVEEVLKRRRSYELSELTSSVWERSYKIEFFVRSNVRGDSFMVVISHDRHLHERVISFYAQCYELQIQKILEQRFKRESIFWKIGSGETTPSAFAVAYTLGRFIK